ncbi:hypothetical protein [uncultured Gammaproteobacteria bacterium]|jgi:hypothetical protein|nr:hypothetical protein BROOK1789C_374 [Bathymodiolus brooksi thiotrophic gill symbiont]CAC9528724.1 hypothetical protein [uncultured Gammaproteobacteria bacterium]CAC9549129.1 hypothetical protein [uncultured Gammaproteobacteria bacterium]CAC9552044.1 hypothetical protein [uncultured Gammaproteobacteria bacterium]CAC9556428.1 hypothetical protein [uncultured Gammaproteobacteria bacterium]
MRVKSKWHKSQVKTIEDIGGAMAFICWRITKNHLEDLINEGFVIEKEQVFNVIIEYLCFLIQSIDRLVFKTLNTEQRQELINKLAKQSAFYYQENKTERIGEGNHWKSFINTYNQRSKDYSDYDFTSNEPSYHFLRYFSEKVKLAMTDVDAKWIVQQMIEIQAPKAFKKIAQSVDDLVSVDKIISKERQIEKKDNKIPRAKRKSTRQDLQ